MYCGHCGKELAEGEICLCEIMGTEETPAAQNDMENVYSYTYPPAQPPENKKKTTLKTALAAVLIGALIFSGAAFGFSVMKKAISESLESTTDAADSQSSFDEINGDFEIASSGIEYTKGEVIGNTYSNEWANLQTELDGRFAEGTQEDYDFYENLLYDCGAYFIAGDDGDEVCVVFYNAGDLTVKEYAEEASEAWEISADDYYRETFSDSYIEKITYERQYDSVEIAGEKYFAVHLIIKFDGEINSIYSDFCAEKDGRIINISIVSDSVGESIELAGGFKACK